MGISGAFMLPHPPLIVPEIGKGEEKKIQKTINAYHTAARKIAELKPETIVVFSPKMALHYDMEFVQELCHKAENRNLPAGTMGEREPWLDHGTMAPLYFVNQYWTDYQLVRIGLSGLPFGIHYELGMCIKDTIEALGRNTALIASGDLSEQGRCIVMSLIITVQRPLAVHLILLFFCFVRL